MGDASNGKSDVTKSRRVLLCLNNVMNKCCFGYDFVGRSTRKDLTRVQICGIGCKYCKVFCCIKQDEPMKAIPDDEEMQIHLKLTKKKTCVKYLCSKDKEFSLCYIDHFINNKKSFEHLPSFIDFLPLYLGSGLMISRLIFRLFGGFSTLSLEFSSSSLTRASCR